MELNKSKYILYCMTKSSGAKQTKYLVAQISDYLQRVNYLYSG